MRPRLSRDELVTLAAMANGWQPMILQSDALPTLYRKGLISCHNDFKLGVVCTISAAGLEAVGRGQRPAASPGNG